MPFRCPRYANDCRHTSGRACASLPRHRTVPALGCNSPARTRSSVVLPLPFGPWICSTWPASTSNPTLLKSLSPPRSKASLSTDKSASPDLAVENSDGINVFWFIDRPLNLNALRATVDLALPESCLAIRVQCPCDNRYTSSHRWRENADARF